MLSTEECIEILNHDMLEISEGVIINCNTNTLDIIPRGLSIVLNESQKRLLVCLVKKAYTKRDIINIVWYENHQRISDNNYHQLTFQLRALLHRNNLPANLLITVPYYGLKLNESQWKTLATPHVEGDSSEKSEIVIKGSRLANDNCPNNLIQEAETTQRRNITVMESFLRTPYLSHPSITQNAFILCMFVALVIFI